MREAERPVAVLFNARGDYLLSLPALRALAGIWPGRLELVCRRGARRTFFPNLDLAAVCEPTTEGQGDCYDFDVDRVCAAAGGADLLISLNPWHGSALDTLLERLDAARSVGFHRSFDVQLPLDFTIHSAELAFEVPRSVDSSLAIESFAQPPQLLEGSERIAARIAALARPTHTIVAVHNETKPEKTCPARLFSAAVGELLDRHPDWVVFDLGQKKTGLGTPRHAERVVPCGDLPLSAALALAGEADLFVGADSCFLHAADLYRVPAVGLFGPTDAHEFGVRFGPHRHVSAADGQMGAIEPAAVVEAVESLATES